MFVTYVVAAFMAGPNWGEVAVDLVAVSYTHLDVYKRQDQLREQLNDAISGGNVTPAADVVVENAVEADTEAAEPSTCLLYTSRCV